MTSQIWYVFTFYFDYIHGEISLCFPVATTNRIIIRSALLVLQPTEHQSLCHSNSPIDICTYWMFTIQISVFAVILYILAWPAAYICKIFITCKYKFWLKCFPLNPNNNRNYSCVNCIQIEHNLIWLCSRNFECLRYLFLRFFKWILRKCHDVIHLNMEVKLDAGNTCKWISPKLTYL